MIYELIMRDAARSLFHNRTIKVEYQFNLINVILISIISIILILIGKSNNSAYS